MAYLCTVHNPFPQSLLPLSPSPPHPSLPHTMLVHHSTSPALFSSSHKWTLLSTLAPCGLDQEDRSPVVLVESHSPLVSTRPLYSSILSTPLILECTTVQLMFLHQVSSMWTHQQLSILPWHLIFQWMVSRFIAHLMFTFHPSSFTALPAPQVTITPSGSSTAGSPYTLTCTVMAVNGLVVVPQVMWLKNGTSVVGGNVTSGIASSNTTNHTLQFISLHTSNGGQYSCIANVSIPVISITSLYNTTSANVIVQS